jgi:hypothetical protein
MKKLLAIILFTPALASAGWKCADNACQSASWSHDGISESRIVSSLPQGTPLEPFAVTPSEIAAQLAASKADAISRIKVFHAGVINTLTGNEESTEKETWTAQLLIAQEVQAGGALSPHAQAMFTGRGETTSTERNAFAATAQAKANAYMYIIGIAGKIKKKALACIDAATVVTGVGTCLTTAQTDANAAMSSAQAAIAALPK